MCVYIYRIFQVSGKYEKYFSNEYSINLKLALYFNKSVFHGNSWSAVMLQNSNVSVNWRMLSGVLFV